MGDIRNFLERKSIPFMDTVYVINEMKQETNRQTELSNCTFVKTALMLIVVVYHCVIFWSENWFTKDPIHESTILSNVASWMNSFHIYGFVLVSGYLFFYLKQEKEKYLKILPFVMNKAKRLLVPYIFVSLIWIIPFAVYYTQLSIQDIVNNYLLGISPSQLWFLLMLFGVFMIFYPLSNFMAKHNVGGAMVTILFYGIGLVGQALLPNIFQVFKACMYIPFFWLGFKMRQRGSQRLMKIPIIMWLLVDVALFMLAQYFATCDGVIFTLLGGNFLLHIVGALMAFVILQKFANRINWKESKVFSFLSKNSMPVYLFHQQVIYIFITCLNGVVNPYLHAWINFVAAMAVSLLISTVLMKFKWTRVLIGEK